MFSGCQAHVTSSLPIVDVTKDRQQGHNQNHGLSGERTYNLKLGFYSFSAVWVVMCGQKTHFDNSSWILVRIVELILNVPLLGTIQSVLVNIDLPSYICMYI